MYSNFKKSLTLGGRSDFLIYFFFILRISRSSLMIFMIKFPIARISPKVIGITLPLSYISKGNATTKNNITQK